MRYVLAIVLILAMVLQPFTKLLIVTNYVLNVKSITVKYCENKAKPRLKCKGKCHLKKQLIQHDKQSDQDKNQVKELNAFSFFTFVSKARFVPLRTQSSSNHFTYLLRESEPFLEVILQPPVC